jgi:hypothetical protein
MGIAATQLSAQTGSEVIRGTYEGPWYVPLVCDDQFVDWLVMTDYTIQNINHYQNGEMSWSKGRWINVILKTSSGDETFVVHGGENGGPKGSKGDYMYEQKLNLLGSKGSHYILHLWWNFSTGEYGAKTNCH